MSALHEQLQKLRELNQATVKHITESTNISPRAYLYYERGKQIPSATVLLTLAEYYDVSTDYLLGRTDNPNSHKL